MRLKTWYSFGLRTKSGDVIREVSHSLEIVEGFAAAGGER